MESINLKNLQTNNLVENRLAEFKALNKDNNNNWFSELCFCILTSNSKAQTALNIQAELGAQGFLSLSEEEIALAIRKNKHRFHNTKAKYIVAARKYKNIKDIVLSYKSGKEAREFIAKNINGLGYKESSHFLRNVGYSDVAIIDRHILRFMKAENLISEIPKVITPSFYLKCEDILKNISPDLDRLDLIIWQKVTGKVLK